MCITYCGPAELTMHLCAFERKAVLGPLDFGSTVLDN